VHHPTTYPMHGTAWRSGAARTTRRATLFEAPCAPPGPRYTVQYGSVCSPFRAASHCSMCLKPGMMGSFAPLSGQQGLTLVHFSPQLERCLWDRGCA